MAKTEKLMLCDTHSVYVQCWPTFVIPEQYVILSAILHKNCLLVLCIKTYNKLHIGSNIYSGNNSLKTDTIHTQMQKIDWISWKELGFWLNV